MKYQDYINFDEEDDRAVTRPSIDIPSTYDKHDAFSLVNTGRRYDHQFFSMYQARLSSLKERVDKMAIEKWGNGDKMIDGKVVNRIEKILNITSNQLCWVSGTVFCELSNKLNILKDVAKGIDDVLPKNPASYVSQDTEEIVMLEDDSGRAILQGTEFFKSHIIVTGVIVAVLGIELQAGIFEVVDVVYPSVAPQKHLQHSTQSGPSSKIAFISGLEITDSVNYDFKLELLKQYLQGLVETDKGTASCISHIVIAGNTIKAKDDIDDGEYHTSNNYGTKNISRFSEESLKLFDRFIGDLVASCSISIMPGETDPTDICLPQQKLHRSFFLSSKQYVGSNIQSLTNPSWLQFNGVRYLGTSGQNIDDIIKYLPQEQSQKPEVVLDIMESTLKWQNIAPTAPDTLYCYPFDNCDPFTLNDETPEVYFVGNQNIFCSKKIIIGTNEVKLISLPKFGQTGQFVLFDPETLEAEVITIG